MSQPTDQWRQIVAKAWDDPNFHQMLVSNPAGTLQAEGIDVAAGTNIHVHQATQSELHLVIPAKPDGLSVEEASQALIGDAHPGF